MTTLAIIGNGIAARSLLYSLAKAPKVFSKILIFDSQSLANPCSFHSTAIVAPRGVTRGNSELGNLLVDGFTAFAEHFEKDLPDGVQEIVQYTGANHKLDQFQKRYPQGGTRNEIDGIRLKSFEYFAEERAFMVDPKVYLNWLLTQSSQLPLTICNEFVTSVTDDSKVQIKTLQGNCFEADKVVFCTGTYSRFWKQFFNNKKLNSSKPVQGSFFSVENIDLNLKSLSITFNGCNFIYNSRLKKMLIGSTTSDIGHELAPKALHTIYQSLENLLDIKLPSVDMGKVEVGLREKCSKREPYLFSQGNVSFNGGYYKNGYILSMKVGQDLSKMLCS